MNAVPFDISGPFVGAEFGVFLYWIQERDRIRRAKEAGQPKPWTPDALLRDYRWCNVRRLDDRVSRWLFEHWYGPDADEETHVVAATLARLVNWPDALAEISPGRPFQLRDLNVAQEILAARAARGAKTFTGGAYIVPGVPGMSKPASVIRTTANVHREVNLIRACVSMGATWNAFTYHDGIGSFLAGQIVADLSHLSAGADWPDRDTWAPLGPGSARGINRLLGRPKDKAISQAEFEKLLAQLVDVVKPAIGGVWSDRRLQAMDIQNCLCEFDKYRRLTLGEGKVRARYDGRAESGRLL